MGTFVANFTLFTSSGVVASDGIVVIPNTHYLSPFHGTGLSGNMIWSLSTISLDGGAPISWSGLPSGFTPIFVSVLPTTPQAPFTQIFYLRKGVIGNVSQGTFTWDVFGPTATVAPGIGVDYPPTFPSLSPGDSFDLQSSITVDFLLTQNSVDASLQCFAYDAIKITGTYTIQSFTSTIDGVHIPLSEAMIPRSFTMGGGGAGVGYVPPGSIIKPTQIPPGGIVPGYDFPPVIDDGMIVFPTYIPSASMNTAGKIYPGDLIRITTSDPNLDLTDVVLDDGTGVSGISLTYPDNLGVIQIIYILTIFIFYQSPTLILFQIPPYLPKKFEGGSTVPGYPNIPIIPKIEVVGTTFTGSINLAPITISLADNSGIYFLSNSKTNDTLYDNINTPDTTDVKIPDPFIKTGFIGG